MTAKTNKSSVGIALEVISAVGLLCCILIPVFYWSRLPNSIPIHFGGSGEPDAWSDKGSIVLLPIFGIGFVHTVFRCDVATAQYRAVGKA